MLCIPTVYASHESSNQLTLSDDPFDPALKHVLAITPSNSSLQAIIQFDSIEISQDQKLEILHRGLVIQHQTSVVPSLLVSGSVEQIADLSNHPGLRWVEWNSPLQLHMNQTVDTIDARELWDRSSLRADGGSDLQASGPTGEGVTVVVLDSGIDATHPDLDYNPQSPSNPSRPSPSDKVIYNAKLDQGSGSATPEFAWVQMQNTDTTSGHGTHCAGTVAGNGQASAGDKKGVAPDAWLIGLSMGEAAFTIDEYSGLEHTYELSRPDSATQDAWNIRVVTNSWGPGFPFDSLDPNDLTVQIINKLSYDNNVVVIFANGNDGGDGGDDRSNIFAKVPSAIGVAAANRNGIGMSDFSSRGDKSDITTWPDIAAPGVGIWSAAARASMIGLGTGAGDTASSELDYYYLAISGTSMATPHVAGLVALMFQVAPNLHMSDIDEDLSSEGDPTLYDPQGIANPITSSRQIHEVEAILKMTADRIEVGENLASNSSLGLIEHELDYAQGYGMINSTKAVAMAYALQQLRDPDFDGVLEKPEIDVFSAYDVYPNVLSSRQLKVKGEFLRNEWNGDFATVSSENSLPPVSAHRHGIFVPKGATIIQADLEYGPLPSELFCPTISNLRLALDADGNPGYEHDQVNGEEMVFQGGTTEDAWWYYDVQGEAAGSCIATNPSTLGPRVPYTVSVKVTMQIDDYSLDHIQARGYTIGGASASSFTIERLVFQPYDSKSSSSELTGFSGAFQWMQENWWLPLGIGTILFVAMVLTSERGKEWLSEISARDEEDGDEDILEAEVIEDAEVIEEAEVIESGVEDGGLLSRVSDVIMDAELI